MKQRKFRSKTAADNFARVTGYKAIRGRACKLKDGTRANWYRFVKKKAPKRRKRRY